MDGVRCGYFILNSIKLSSLISASPKLSGVLYRISSDTYPVYSLVLFTEISFYRQSIVHIFRLIVY